MKNSKLLIILMVFPFVVSSCHKVDEEDNYFEVSQVITANSGGTINTPDGSKIVIPAGALQNDATVTIQTVASNLNSTAHIKAVGNIYKIGPDGTVFNKPIDITLKYSTDDLPQGEYESRLSVFVNNGSEYVICPSYLNTAEKTITFSTIHFSDYVVGTSSGSTTSGPIMGYVNMIVKDNKVYASFRLENHFLSPSSWWSDQSPWWKGPIYSLNQLMQGFGNFYPGPGWFYRINLCQDNLLRNPVRETKEVLFYFNKISDGGGGYYIQAKMDPGNIHLASYTEGGSGSLEGSGLLEHEAATVVSGEGLLVEICDVSLLSTTSKYFIEISASACAVYSNSAYEHYVAYSYYKDSPNGKSQSNYPLTTGNNSPTIPINRYPANNLENLDISIPPYFSTTPVYLSWSSSDPDGDGVVYDVYFGTDPNPSTVIAPNHPSNSIDVNNKVEAGTKYYWKIVAKDNKGGTTSGPIWNYSIRNYDSMKPVVSFTGLPTTITAGQSVQFTGQATNSPLVWLWDFGDGSTSTLQSPAHTYSTPGNYTVSLTVGNLYGSNTKTLSNYITVSFAPGFVPVANFTADHTTISAGGSVQFTDLSENNPTSWVWDFGDLSYSYDKNPLHQYNNPGTFTVSLTAKNSSGENKKSVSNYITVNLAGSPPIANFIADRTTISAGGSVQFTDLSENNPTNWVWDFGDLSYSYDKNPLHQYNNPGTFTVSLTAKNSSGENKKTVSNYITVNPSSSGIIFNPNSTYGSLSDVDGNTYKTIEIGTQTWMAENLKTTKYNDGSAIPPVTDNNAWYNLTTPGYCWYNNDAVTYKATYGALYNWYAVNTGKLCPTSWHVPTDAEWTTLTTFLEGESVAGGKLKETGTTHWRIPNTGATNETGFTALPGGYRFGENTFGHRGGTFDYIGDVNGWWSSTEYSTTNIWYRALNYGETNIYRYRSIKPTGWYVRCVRDF